MHAVGRLIRLTVPILHETNRLFCSKNSNIQSIYTQRLEPKLLSIKNAMKTNIEPVNIHHIDKCTQQIDEINNELKEFCATIGNKNGTNIDALNQNITNLHQQLQQKTKMNKQSEENITDLEEQLEYQRVEIQQLNDKINTIQNELKETINEKNILNESLNENKTIILELKDKNNIKNESNEIDQNIEENEVNKTKNNMAHLLKDLVELENEYKKLKMICGGLGVVILFGLMDKFRTKNKIKKTEQELEEIKNKIHKMFFFERNAGDSGEPN
eukprot:300405_1